MLTRSSHAGDRQRAEQRMGSAAFEALRLLSLRVLHRPLDEVRAELDRESTA